MVDKPDWFPSKQDLATSLLTSIITSALTALAVFLITTYVLSTPVSPTTKHEVSVVSAYPSGENEYTLVVENTGDFEEKEIVVFLTDHSDYRRLSEIQSLSPGQDVALIFSLPEPKIQSFERQNSTHYKLKNVTQARAVCSQKNPRNLEASNPVIRVTEEHISGEFAIPKSYTIGVEYQEKRNPTYRMTFTYPHEYTMSEEVERRVVPVTVTKQEGICYFNDFPLFWLIDEDGEYTDYAPK